MPGLFTLKHKPQVVFWSILLLLVLTAAALRGAVLYSFPLTSDEGIHLMWLRLLAAGYAPYREVYITYPPLYPLAIELVWRWWPGEAAQRWFSVACAIFGAVGVALLARQLAGAVAGLVAAALVLFSAALLGPSVSVLGEFPSVAWSVWAILLAWQYREAGRARPALAALSGLCLAASLLTKLLSPFVVVLIPLLLLTSRPPGWPPQQPYSLRMVKTQPRLLWPLLLDLVWWGLALLLPALLLMVVYDADALMQQVVGQRLGARAASLADESFWSPRLEIIRGFLHDDPLLVLLAGVGLGLAWRQRLKDFWLILVWLALAAAMLAVHNPVRYKHIFIFTPVLSILGGVTVSWLVAALKATLPASAQKSALPARVAGVGLAALLFGLVAGQAWLVQNLWQANASVPQPPKNEVDGQAFIEQVTAPGDCLITDSMQLVYRSGRMIPPELAEVSINRMVSGALTTAELIDITNRYDCQLVVAAANRISKYLPDYMVWVKQNYLGRFHYGDDDLFFAKGTAKPNPASPLMADFAGQITFYGYTLPPAPINPGSRLPITLVWQAQTRPAADYTIFVQLRDASQNTLASADHQPYNWLAATSKWPPGAVIQETSWLQLPADLPAGEYRLYVGLYRQDTLARLPITGDTSGENALILGPVVVAPAGS